VLTVGLLLIVANLVWSRFRGPLAGPNPFGAPSLEWATSSPPPPYNFPQIPRVSSEYPLWDGLEPSGLTLADGHEQPLTTVRDGYLDEIEEMPAESAAPIVIALALALASTMLLTSHYASAGIFVLVAAFAVGVWHWREPGH
jgi:cytochrome c oxidase subunit 1/cytochrome c oxidase subunit I+III